MAPLIAALESSPEIEAVSIATGQHEDMLAQVLDVFGIEPDYDLKIMRPNQTLFDISGEVMFRMRDVLEELRPSVLLVHGDTTTAFAAALAAFYLGIPVGHVEAGLRTGDMANPFPEEMNRAFIDRVSRIMFAPTTSARNALLSEGLDESRIHTTGNTVIDALQMIKRRIDTDTSLSADLDRRFAFLDPGKRLILTTGHRRESFGIGLENVCRGLKALAARGDVEVLYPVHLNQNVRNAVNTIISDTANIHLIEPVDYITLVYLLGRSHVVVTDSGGIQEEAPALGKPVFVTRTQTERPEAVAAGVARLVGTDSQRLEAEVGSALDNPAIYGSMSQATNPYGQGDASTKIVQHLQGLLNGLS